MSTPLRVLILEDWVADAELMLHELRRAGYELDWRRVETASDYLACLEPTLDIILADYSLPQFDALRALSLLQERDLDIPFIIVTGSISEEVAVECMKQGVADYLLKDRLGRLGPAVEHALREKKTRQEKRRAEVALRESEERYQRITQALTDYIYTVRVEHGRVAETLHGAGCVAVTGYTSEEFAADAYLWYNMVKDQDRSAVREQAERVLAGEDVRPLEHRIIHKDGAERWVRNTPVPYRDGEGKLLGYDGLVQDITERKRAEEALRQSESLYRRAIETAGAVPYYQDYGLGAYLFMGEGIQQLTGYAPDEMSPKLWGSLVLDVKPRGAASGLDRQEAVRRARAGEFKVWQCDMLVRTRDGQTRWVADSAVEIRDEQGILQGSIGILQDITARKRAEQVQAALYRISEAAQVAQDLNELFGLIHAIVGELMPASNFYIALYDASTDLFMTPYLVDEFSIPPPPYKPGKGLNAYVLRTGEPLLATPTVFERLVQSGQVELIGKPAVDWLGVPLKTQHGTIGVMAVYTYTEAAHLTEVDKDVLVFVSTQVAMAIERKRVEDALRTSEARFRALIENSNDMILLLDPDGAIRYASPSVQHVMGYVPEDLVGRNVFELVHPEDLARVSSEMLSVVQGPGGLPSTTQARVRHADGSWHIHEGVGSNLLGDPAVASFVMNSRDITERKRTEEEIQRLNQDLQRHARELAALNQAGQIMASTLDLNTLLERVMEQVRVLLDAEGASVLLRPADADAASDELVFAAATGPRAEKLPGLRLSSAGVAGWVMRERQAALIADAQNDPRHERQVDALTGLTTRSLLAVPLISKGTVLGVIEAVNKGYGTFDDHDLRVMESLTSSAAIAIENAGLFSMLNREKQRLEFLYHLSQQLTESLDMREIAQRALDGLRAVAGLLRGLVAVRERDSLRLVAVSGYDAESLEALNQRLPLRVGYGLIGWVAAQHQPAIVDDVTQDPRWVVVSGLDEWVRSALSVPLLSGDELVGVLSIYSERVAYFTEDIRRLVESAAATVAVAITNARLYSTERQRATELARALEQQRELDRLQREFIQNVSHELRTPLSLIRGHAEVLEVGWLGELLPEQRESIEVISRRAQMLGKLVDDILRLLEIERRDLGREAVDLGQLVQTSTTDFQAAADQAGLTLSAEVTPELPLVSGDPVALRRALDNLVSNAFKFTPAGGRVNVRLSRREGAVKLEVADTGIGIPGDQLTRIFERFYQVDGSATRKYGGMGLGLALVKEIVEAHGGQITVTSQVGVGTTFTIVLPIVAQDDPVTW